MIGYNQLLKAHLSSGKETNGHNMLWGKIEGKFAWSYVVFRLLLLGQAETERKAGFNKGV